MSAKPATTLLVVLALLAGLGLAGAVTLQVLDQDATAAWAFASAVIGLLAGQQLPSPGPPPPE